MEKFGIDNIKRFLGFGFKVAGSVDNALADDGKMSLTEALSLVPEVLGVPQLISAFPALKQEIVDLSPEEKDELYLWVKETFGIQEEELEAAIEEALGVALSLISLLNRLKAIKAAKSAGE